VLARAQAKGAFDESTIQRHFFKKPQLLCWHLQQRTTLI
jgi:hypothetical protein